MQNFTADDLLGLEFADNGRGGFALVPASTPDPVPLTERERLWAEGYRDGWSAATRDEQHA
jgi:hypothetical protein